VTRTGTHHRLETVGNLAALSDSGLYGSCRFKTIRKPAVHTATLILFETQTQPKFDTIMAQSGAVPSAPSALDLPLVSPPEMRFKGV
jgi:hypothetical protein